MGSAYAAAVYLKSKKVTKAYVVGEQGLMEELSSVGVKVGGGGSGAALCMLGPPPIPACTLWEQPCPGVLLLLVNHPAMHGLPARAGHMRVEPRGLEPSLLTCPGHILCPSLAPSARPLLLLPAQPTCNGRCWAGPRTAARAGTGALTRTLSCHLTHRCDGGVTSHATV
jgi:hypothetical protein